MGHYPVEIRRCQHLRTNGTQCGAPALREQKFCYHHRENQPEQVKVKGEDGETSTVLIPLWEDGASIQIMVRKVAVMLLEGKIDSRKAGLVLYALQIASTNLKRVDEEEPRPPRVVVDTEKVAETPMGMTPWSSSPQGHEPESDASGELERVAWQVSQQWEREFRRTFKSVEGRVKGLKEWLAEQPSRPVDIEWRKELDLLKGLLENDVWRMERTLTELSKGEMGEETTS